MRNTPDQLKVAMTFFLTMPGVPFIYYGDEIGMRAIERENKRLKDILPKNFARPELDKRRLGEVVDLFTNKVKMHEDGGSKDILGRTYEYCLSNFAKAEGKLAGEFYTPACLIRIDYLKLYITLYATQMTQKF